MTTNLTPDDEKKLSEQFTSIFAWLGRLSASEVAMRRLLRELAPTMTDEQTFIIARYPAYCYEAHQTALIGLENTDPGAAAAISNALPGNWPYVFGPLKE